MAKNNNENALTPLEALMIQQNQSNKVSSSIVTSTTEPDTSASVVETTTPENTDNSAKRTLNAKSSNGSIIHLTIGPAYRMALKLASKDMNLTYRQLIEKLIEEECSEYFDQAKQIAAQNIIF